MLRGNVSQLLSNTDKMSNFRHSLDAIRDTALGVERRNLVGDDSTVRLLKCGMPDSDFKDKSILIMAPRTALIVSSSRTTPTFRRLQRK